MRLQHEQSHLINFYNETIMSLQNSQSGRSELIDANENKQLINRDEYLLMIASSPLKIHLY